MKTEYIKLTDLWYDGKYLEVGNVIREENWKPNEIAEFCLYFVKYVGLKEFELLHKFL
jgi:hypothetical protein